MSNISDIYYDKKGSSTKIDDILGQLDDINTSGTTRDTCIDNLNGLTKNDIELYLGTYNQKYKDLVDYKEEIVDILEYNIDPTNTSYIDITGSTKKYLEYYIDKNGDLKNLLEKLKNDQTKTDLYKTLTNVNNELNDYNQNQDIKKGIIEEKIDEFKKTLIDKFDKYNNNYHMDLDENNDFCISENLKRLVKNIRNTIIESQKHSNKILTNEKNDVLNGIFQGNNTSYNNTEHHITFGNTDNIKYQNDSTPQLTSKNINIGNSNSINYGTRLNIYEQQTLSNIHNEDSINSNIIVGKKNIENDISLKSSINHSQVSNYTSSKTINKSYENSGKKRVESTSSIKIDYLETKDYYTTTRYGIKGIFNECVADINYEFNGYNFSFAPLYVSYTDNQLSVWAYFSIIRGIDYGHSKNALYSNLLEIQNNFGHEIYITEKLVNNVGSEKKLIKNDNNNNEIQEIKFIKIKKISTEIKKDILLSNYNDNLQLIGNSNNDTLDIDKAIEALEQKISKNNQLKQQASVSTYSKALLAILALFFLYSIAMTCMYFFTKNKLKSNRNKNKSYSDIDIIVIE